MIDWLAGKMRSLRYRTITENSVTRYWLRDTIAVSAMVSFISKNVLPGLPDSGFRRNTNERGMTIISKKNGRIYKTNFCHGTANFLSINLSITISISGIVAVFSFVLYARSAHTTARIYQIKWCDDKLRKVI